MSKVRTRLIRPAYPQASGSTITGIDVFAVCES